MGTKNSKPPTRLRRNIPSSAETVPDLEALHAHIEQERERLMDAEAVLDCVLYAMDEDERMSAPGPSYANVIRIVRGLVNATIDKLDSANVKAVKCRGVKETPPAYLH